MSKKTKKVSELIPLSISMDVLIARIKLIGLGVLLLLGFSYLMMMNSLATKGFALEGFKSERIALQKQLETVDIGLAIPTSLYALESSELVQQLPPVGQKLFLIVEPDGIVAFESDVSPWREELVN